MAVIKRKTKQAITKQVRKLIKEHGPEIALGLATGLIGTVIEAASGDAAEKPKRSKAKGKKKKDDGAEEPEKKREKKPEKKAKKSGGKKKAGKKSKKNEKDSAS